MKKRIMCYGDSNTWGFVAGTGERFDENTRWTGVLQNELGSDYTVIEEGLNGRTSTFDIGFDTVLNGLTGLGYALKTDYPLDLVIIALGTNDIPEHSALRMQKGVEEIVRQVKNANWIVRAKQPIFPNGAKILLIEPIPFSEGCNLSQDRIEESKKFHQAFEAIAKETGVELLTITDFAKASPVDGIHLTKETHIQLGKVVANRVKAII